MEAKEVPRGCGSSVHSVYHNLCDLTKMWGVVVAALAAAGVVASLILFALLVVRLRSATDAKRKAMAVLQAAMLIFTLGLFGLTFAFIAGKHSASCSARRFLFGVLFAGCLACLLMHAVWLALLERRRCRPRGWMLYLGALGLWLVEIIINAEWLVLTLTNPLVDMVPDLSCLIQNRDFVMALTYVLALLLAVLVLALPALTHKRKQWRGDGGFILLAGVFTLVVWIGWIFMYINGNRAIGDPSWDDPTLAVALAANAWGFLGFYVIPELARLSKEDPDEELPHDGDHIYPTRRLVYDNILKQAESTHQNIYIENKAFTMEEPPAVPAKPVSPYGSYNGQLRSCVYQPTELALIAKGMTKMDQDNIIPRATLQSMHPGSSRTPSVGSLNVENN